MAHPSIQKSEGLEFFNDLCLYPMPWWVCAPTSETWRQTSGAPRTWPEKGCWCHPNLTPLFYPWRWPSCDLTSRVPPFNQNRSQSYFQLLEGKDLQITLTCPQAMCDSPRLPCCLSIPCSGFLILSRVSFPFSHLLPLDNCPFARPFCTSTLWVPWW